MTCVISCHVGDLGFIASSSAQAIGKYLLKQNGEGSSRRTRQTLHERNDSRLQEVEVEPVSKHILDSN
ncbi:hypothetical protein L1987_35881 [Smallanthus sonchifolius]|uniref:Uncharacterized protein n=1 Tax=Smallanthus sonchifolius TaxID=185202 RepID=A0ACB9HDM9_9ASTR|nr:hypothetical protein L1987_35881 [Smallanthus sonchifolius]